MIKKMSLVDLLKEDDALKYDKNLNVNVQKLPQLIKTFQDQLKTDEYNKAIQTLANLSMLSQQIQQQLQSVIQQNPQVKNPGDQSLNQQVQNKVQTNISNKEI